MTGTDQAENYKKILRLKTQDLMISHFENAYAFHEKSNPRQAAELTSLSHFICK